MNSGAMEIGWKHTMHNRPNNASRARTYSTFLIGSSPRGVIYDPTKNVN